LFVLVKIRHVKNHLVMSCFLLSCIPRYFRVVMSFLVNMKMILVTGSHQLNFLVSCILLGRLMRFVSRFLHMSFVELMLLLLNDILLVMRPLTVHVSMMMIGQMNLVTGIRQLNFLGRLMHLVSMMKNHVIQSALRLTVMRCILLGRLKDLENQNEYLMRLETGSHQLNLVTCSRYCFHRMSFVELKRLVSMKKNLVIHEQFLEIRLKRLVERNFFVLLLLVASRHHLMDVGVVFVFY
jgi:hypothetical protein